MQEKIGRVNTLPFTEKGNIKMIAHRGLSGLERENTCPAFVAAGVKSYYGVETDVHVTKDGKLIVVHDDDLLRVAGLNIPVEESTFAELRAVRLRDTDGVTERADLFLPSLDEYLSICKKYNKQAVLELKNGMSQACVERVADAVESCGWTARTTFISFFGENLLRLRAYRPSASIQFLSERNDERDLRFTLDHGFDADLCADCLAKDYVAELHAHGRVVNCWTVDSLKEARRVQACGVDMITTDILE